VWLRVAQSTMHDLAIRWSKGSIPGRGIQPQTELFPRFISLRSDCRDLTARLPAAEYPLKHRFFCRKRSG
jgi:hypothetical protein